MKKVTWMLGAWGGSLLSLLVLAACTFEERVPAEMVSMSRAQALGTEKSLDSTIRFDIGSLEITAGEKPEELYSFDLEYDKAGFVPDYHYDPAPAGGEGRFSFNLQGTHKSGIRKKSQNNKIRLAFNKSIPLSLTVNAGVGDARLSLSGMRLSRVKIESGVGAAKLAAYEPNPIPCEYIGIKSGVGGIEAVGLGNLDFQKLEFEGGVGGANLDLSGEWKRDAEIQIKVGVGGVNVQMPREIGVQVDTEKHFLSGVQLEGFQQRGSEYYSSNYDSAAIRVRIRVETGIGGLKVSWI